MCRLLLILNRKDEATLGMFFKVLKERCPKVKVKTLMIDDGKSLYTHDVRIVRQKAL